MALQEIDQQTQGYLGSNAGKPPIDFYRVVTNFTKDLTDAQLLLLRDHLNTLSDDTQSQDRPKHQSKLSKRETEVLILLANGYHRRDIGASLGISANTAARHIANIYQKLGISCVAEATHYALSHHIIS